MVKDVCGGYFLLQREWHSLSHHYTNAQQHEGRGVEKTQSGEKTTLEWWNHWNKVLPAAPVYFFIFFKAAPPTRGLSDGQGREAKSDFVGVVQGSSAVPMTRVAEVWLVCSGGSGDLICHLWAHNLTQCAWLAAPSLLRLLLCSFGTRKWTTKLPKSRG